MSFFKLVKLARNVALANLFVWMGMDWLNVYQLDWYTASVNGLILFVFQYLVLNVGMKMTSNSNNRNNSKLKNALICTGITFNENISEKVVREKYSGRNVKILHGLPLVGILIVTLMFNYTHHPMIICWLLFFGSLTIAVQPIYHAMIQEQAEKQA
ncbi:hypothetical protein UA32_12635 [Photobacterium angustum]|uniref:Uncharacterized protein n=1 Tax=Photobacterium angustum TaxID=661 RepID=A0ABX5H1D0_PHOAN|nr:hypothetical protein [Photobacterium angustum]KJG37792.1 hypothetical protein UA32_12635 [Photobacterium angustum]PSX07061.1 hypothetical protein C0W27_15950 [Photobacterium angustum]